MQEWDSPHKSGQNSHRPCTGALLTRAAVRFFRVTPWRRQAHVLGRLVRTGSSTPRAPPRRLQEAAFKPDLSLSPLLSSPRFTSTNDVRYSSG